MDAAAQDGQAASGLPAAWADTASWSVLDTDFGHGDRFLSICNAWRSDPRRPRMLHYVAVSDATTPLAAALQAQLSHLGPGFHRIFWDTGQISLTYCVGDVQSLLTQHRFQADTVFAGVLTDKWDVQRLARRCRKGTRVHLRLAAPKLASLMIDAGFTQVETPYSNAAVFVFEPRWMLTRLRDATLTELRPPGRCAIIGAGISGATVANALARRGWHVTVFDQETTPAAGASGIPAALVVPHVSADDSPRSRLTRVGAHLMLQHASSLLVQGQDWQACGVMERRPGSKPFWHANGAWIKPAALVHALLAQSRCQFLGGVQVQSFNRAGGAWQLKDSRGASHSDFDVVVVANAAACKSLPSQLADDLEWAGDVREKLAALQPVHGTLSCGHYLDAEDVLAGPPLNGNGCFIPSVPGDRGIHWYAGSSFETDPLRAADLGAQHADNMVKLRSLLGEEGQDWWQALEGGPISLWTATRCVAHDRLPLVGTALKDPQAGLWLCSGMGSRGMSFSAVCAEWIAARLGAEPWPVESSLARSLDLRRPRRIKLFATTTSPAAD